jgi:hypothetical protein
MRQVEAADAEDAPDPHALPQELARRETLKDKLAAACARLEEEARTEHEAAKDYYAQRRAAYDAKSGRRGKPPVPPDDGPDGKVPPPVPDAQSNLTDPDSAAHAQLYKSFMGFRRFLMRGLAAVKAEWSLVALAYNAKRMANLSKALQQEGLLSGIDVDCVGMAKSQIRSAARPSPKPALCHQPHGL